MDRLIPNGVPRWIRVWDGGNDDGYDRYTVCYTGRYRGKGWFQHVGMNAIPFHSLYGICQHGESEFPIDCPHGWAEAVGQKCRHNPNLGRRIRFEDLPADCQKVVLQDYAEIWGLTEISLAS